LTWDSFRASYTQGPPWAWNHLGHYFEARAIDFSFIEAVLRPGPWTFNSFRATKGPGLGIRANIEVKTLDIALII
jgi:hypothetical protein